MRNQARHGGNESVKCGMASNQPKPFPEKPARKLRLDAETWVALLATAFSAVLLLLTAMHAGPLWRDEVNTINVAQMPTLHDLWHFLTCESFPPFYPLLLRCCSAIGLAGSDLSIRLLGLSVGWLVLGSFWLCARWLGGRVPTLSIALIGFLPAFIFIAGANRAYGLATILLVLSFASLWRLLQKPSRGRILLAAVSCLLFAHCVYYDVFFLAAMLAGAALVTWRRRQWRTLGWLVGIGAVSAGSLALYLPIVQAGSVYVPLLKWPYFSMNTLWDALRDAVTARSSSEPNRIGPEIRVWGMLVLAGAAAAAAAQVARPTAKSSPDLAAAAARADRALYCLTSLFLGVAGLMYFLFQLQYWTQPWYYIEMLCLVAVALDGLLAADWPALFPWGGLRIVFLLAMMGWSLKAAWTEAHTRRSNLDLVAAVLTKQAVAGDLIVVHSLWEGITFNRYYHGAAQWETVPRVDSHLVHRNDLVWKDMVDATNTMKPVLREALTTLQTGHTVWFVGPVYNIQPFPPGRAWPTSWWLSYAAYWNAQISSLLLEHATREQLLDIPIGGPICRLENLTLVEFTGYQVGTTNSAAAK